MDGWKEGTKELREDGWMDRTEEGRMKDGWMDGWMEETKEGMKE